MTPATPVTVGSEAAYDLLREHLDLVLAVQDAPIPLADAQGSARHANAIPRLIHYGILRKVGTFLTAGSEFIHQLRRENMVAFLERYVLPAVHANLRGDRGTRIWLKTLRLAPSAVREFRRGPIGTLFSTLADTKNPPSARAPRPRRLTVSVVATEGPLDDDMDSGTGSETVAQLVRIASARRASPKAHPTTILSQFDCLANDTRHQSILQVTDTFARDLTSASQTLSERPYHLLLASHWQGTGASPT